MATMVMSFTVLNEPLNKSQFPRCIALAKDDILDLFRVSSIN